MEKIQTTASACDFNALADILKFINRKWKQRWNIESPGFCFRGADKFSYDLNPTLLRAPFPNEPNKLVNIENGLWVEFRLRSKPLLGYHVANAWSALLIMQQYGFPTRLLDWSRSLGVAAYFAVRNLDVHEDGVVWIMAAKHLMELRGVPGAWRTVINDPSIEKLSLRVDDKNMDIFMNQTPVPLSPDQMVDRMIAQSGIYTLHSFEKDSLEKLAIEDAKIHKDACFLHKILIPGCAKEGIRSELSVLAGISEETIFPDLEGFARDFVNQYKTNYRPLV